jgi:hypothetical protein
MFAPDDRYLIRARQPPKDTDGNDVVLLCRVVAGTAVDGEPSMTDAPGSAHSTFKRGVGGRVFCVYDRKAIYPEVCPSRSILFSGSHPHLRSQFIISYRVEGGLPAAATPSLGAAAAPRAALAQAGFQFVDDVSVLDPALVEVKKSVDHPCTVDTPDGPRQGILKGLASQDRQCVSLPGCRVVGPA